MSGISKAITETRAYSCLDCGQCTAACPVSRYDPAYSPRKLVQRLVLGKSSALLKDDQLWSCITCSACREKCRSGVDYTALMRMLRKEAYCSGNGGQCTHGGALQSLMHIMAAENLNQDRLTWLDKSLSTVLEGEVLYFAGCQPYFDVLFSEIGARTLDSARGAVKLLNSLGVVPAVMPNERCCGHDLLWSGDEKGFRRLAEQNLKEIRKTGAKRVVTTCPECYQTLKVAYPGIVGELGFEVVHLTELLAEQAGKLKFRRLPGKVTYHDSCRLGRFSGIYDEPRALLNSVPGLELLEMPRNRANALCCGTHAWVNCGAVNKQIQVELLQEAAATGAGVLLTSCPKCQIHLKCAMNDKRVSEQIKLDIRDLTGYLAGALSGVKGGEA